MKSPNIKLLYQYILLKETQKETQTSTFVLATDENIGYGTVIQLGTGRMLDNGEMSPIPDINVEDEIMFKKGPEMIVNVEGERYLLVMDVNVIMVMNK